MQLKKLTRDEMKNVTGGLDPLPPGCYCWSTSVNPIDVDCLGANSELYCLPEDGPLLCC